MKSTQTRYGIVAKLLHWLMAIFVLILIGTGFRAGFSDDTLIKAQALRVHLPAGIMVLVLTVVRLIWWRFDRKPEPVGSTPGWQALAARWTHRLLYLLTLVLLVSGVGLSALSGLPDALFNGAPMPDLMAYPPRALHGIAARLIAFLLALHVGAALYHHLIIRDNTFRRMWFSRA